MKTYISKFSAQAAAQAAQRSSKIEGYNGTKNPKMKEKVQHLVEKICR